MIRGGGDLLTLKRDTKKEVAVYLVSGKRTKSQVLFVQLSVQNWARHCSSPRIVSVEDQWSLSTRCSLEPLRVVNLGGTFFFFVYYMKISCQHGHRNNTGHNALPRESESKFESPYKVLLLANSQKLLSTLLSSIVQC